MRRATKAPARVQRPPPAPPPERRTAPALEEGTRYATTSRGVVLVGELVHELPREDVELAYRDRILFDPVVVIEVLPR